MCISVIQYGFVTLFVAAFPLAPLFAFANNVIEIRLDAYKFVTTYRRPTPFKSTDIGIWYVILDGLSWLAVVTNACVVAFTSKYIPRIIYMTAFSCDATLEGYVDNSLAYFDTDDFLSHKPSNSSDFGYVSVCRYRDYRIPPCRVHNATANGFCNDDTFRVDPALCEQAKYRLDSQFWHVFCARLAFVLVFEHLVFIVKGFVAYLIPDVTTEIAQYLNKEKYLARQARIQQEIDRAQYEDEDSTAESERSRSKEWKKSSGKRSSHRKRSRNSSRRTRTQMSAKDKARILNAESGAAPHPNVVPQDSDAEGGDSSYGEQDAGLDVYVVRNGIAGIENENDALGHIEDQTSETRL